jgi:predicted ATPase
MELLSFRVLNFRSINDSTPIRLGKRTVLVGRNESGKSALLRALRGLKMPDGTVDRVTFARDYPRDRSRKSFDANLIALETEWTLNDEDRAALGKVWPRASAASGVNISRTYKERRTIGFVGLRPLPDIANDASTEFKKLSKAARAAVKKLLPESEEINAPLAGLEAAIAAQVQEEDWPERVTSSSKSVRDTLTALGVPIAGEVGDAIDAVERAANAVQKDEEQHTAARTWAVGRMPVFVYLDEWDFLSGHEDIDQYLTNVEKKQQTPANRNFGKLLKVAELDAKELKDLLVQNHEERKLLTDRAGRVMTRTLRELWKDREITVSFNVDAGHFDVLVSDQETNALVPLDERSRGFRWYFSFYVTFAADTQNGDKANAILLLDEPGLFLHATAQSSLLRFFDTLPNQIVYTTHSPFMIDPTKLETVRTVNLNDSAGTVVTSDPTGDANTLFPLQAALGYTLTQTLFVGSRNAVVEGVTDYWYLTAASEYLKGQGRSGLKEDVTLTPAGGAPKVPYMVALLTAQDLRVVVLLDSEPQAEQAEKAMVTSKLIRAENVIHVGDAWPTPPVGGADVEDLLDPDVYVALVEESYAKELKELKGPGLTLNPKIPRVVNRVTSAFEAVGLKFHKTRPASLFVRKMATAPEELMGGGTAERFERLVGQLNAAVDKAEKVDREPFR